MYIINVNLYEYMYIYTYISVYIYLFIRMMCTYMLEGGRVGKTGRSPQQSCDFAQDGCATKRFHSPGCMCMFMCRHIYKYICIYILVRTHLNIYVSIYWYAHTHV